MGTSEFLKHLLDQGAAPEQPGNNPRDLLHWVAIRLLLGLETTGAADALQQQASALKPTGHLKRDVSNWTRYAATLEMLGVPAERFAIESLTYFSGQPDLDRDDRGETACCLALSMLASADSSAAPEWLDAARTLPPADSPAGGFFYEPLFLATQGKSLEEPFLSLSASLTARLVFNDLTGAPQHSAAPSICALAAAARRHNTNARDLLSTRLEAIDRVVGDFHQPKIHFQAPVFRSVKPNAMELRVSAAGEGELDTGAYPVEPLTWLFGSLVAQRFHQADAVSPAAVRVILTLPEGITIPAESENFLRLRNEFSWQLLSAHLPRIRANHEFSVRQK